MFLISSTKECVGAITLDLLCHFTVFAIVLMKYFFYAAEVVNSNHINHAALSVEILLFIFFNLEPTHW